MSSHEFSAALAALHAHAADVITQTLVAWSADVGLRQVGENVSNETALGNPDFESLLTSFVNEMGAGVSSDVAWIQACRRHKFRGAKLPVGSVPQLLGRARGLDDQADAVARASRGRGDLTREEARRLLLKHSDSATVGLFEPLLRLASLGRNLIWATFNELDGSKSPFTRIPNNGDDVRTALGLGHYATGDFLVVLVWEHFVSGAPPLHRPTVADAETYPFYRPFSDPSAAWGQTEPLSPNPRGLKGQPECVLPEVAGAGLLLPYRVLRV